MIQLQALGPGETFAHDFRIVAPLASGGMGAVYVVDQLSTGRRRALKVMHPELLRDPKARERFEQEAKVSSRIASDHVVEVVAAGVDATSGAPWLVMELLEGETVAQRAAREGRLAPAVVLEIFRQMCHALGAAHQLGVVHRDLKPENLFLEAPRREGVPFTLKILDFGIAKLTQDVRSTSGATGGVGSPLWMAPEQTHTAGAQPATDVWALGLIAYLLLTGTSYWRAASTDGATLQGLLTEILVSPLDPASTRARERGLEGWLPAGFDAWFARCVARQPEHRFQGASEALAALAPLLGGASSRPAATSIPVTTPGAAVGLAASAAPASHDVPAPPRSSGAIWLAVAGVALALAAVVGVVATAGVVGFSLLRAEAPRVATAPASAPTPAGADPGVAPSALGGSADASSHTARRARAESHGAADAGLAAAPLAAGPATGSAATEAPDDTPPVRKLSLGSLRGKVKACWKGNEGASPDAGHHAVQISFQVNDYGHASAIKVSPNTHKKFTACAVDRVVTSPWGAGKPASLSLAVDL